MAVRKFTQPTSLEETLSREIPREKALPTMNGRSSSSSEQEAVSKSTGTFALQDKLPKLPIPALEDTCDKYLKALRPLQSSREHQDTQTAVREFLKSDGHELNERLKKYATGKTSYIEQFCMYLSCANWPYLTEEI